jgi:multimeric flavodoxin WrbA
VDKDILNPCLEKMIDADGILLGSPTYFADMSADLKALIERAGLVAKANDDLLRRKVGAAVVAVRRAGSVHTLDSINHFFTIGQMIIPGSSYWNLGVGREKGEVAADEEGLRTMRTLGQSLVAQKNQRLKFQGGTTPGTLSHGIGSRSDRQGQGRLR